MSLLCITKSSLRISARYSSSTKQARISYSTLSTLVDAHRPSIFYFDPILTPPTLHRLLLTLANRVELVDTPSVTFLALSRVLSLLLNPLTSLLPKVWFTYQF